MGLAPPYRNDVHHHHIDTRNNDNDSSSSGNGDDDDGEGITRREYHSAHWDAFQTWGPLGTLLRLAVHSRNTLRAWVNTSKQAADSNTAANFIPEAARSSASSASKDGAQINPTVRPTADEPLIYGTTDGSRPVQLWPWWEGRGDRAIAGPWVVPELETEQLAGSHVFDPLSSTGLAGSSGALFNKMGLSFLTSQRSRSRRGAGSSRRSGSGGGGSAAQQVRKAQARSAEAVALLEWVSLGRVAPDYATLRSTPSAASSDYAAASRTQIQAALKFRPGNGAVGGGARTRDLFESFRSYLASLGFSQVVLPTNNLIREQAERQMEELKVASEGGNSASADGTTVGPGNTRSSAIAAVLGGVPSMPCDDAHTASVDAPTSPITGLCAHQQQQKQWNPGGHSTLGTPVALVQQANRDVGLSFLSGGGTGVSSGTASSSRRSQPPTPNSAGAPAEIPGTGAQHAFRGITALAPIQAGHGASTSAAAFARVIGHNHTWTGQPCSPFIYPYPFQVVQMPGGTARAGWWIPKDEVPEERRKKTRTVPGTLTSIVGEDGRVMGSVQEEDEEEEGHEQVKTAGAEADGEDEVMPYFQPRYVSIGVLVQHLLQAADIVPYLAQLPDIHTEEDSALASAAAYATAALTSTRSGPPRTTSREDTDESEDEEIEASDWKPLEAPQQEAIAAQLRAWAGPEGPERRAEARAASGERKAQIFTQAIGASDAQVGDAEGDASSTAGIEPKLATLENPADAVNKPTLATKFWPSDFASDYRAQLRALAESFYVKVHEEALSKVDSAPPVGQ
ncbi:hypothetical protein V8E36_002344 [Tilletia maclaganii]